MTARFERGLTLQEALAIIAGDDELEDEVQGIYIAPPEPSILTDEDTGEEDRGGLIDNLSGKQLSAGAELKTNRSEDIEEKIVVEEDHNSIASTSKNQESATKKRKKADCPSKLKTDRKQLQQRQVSIISELKEELRIEKESKKKKRAVPKNWIDGDLEAQNIKFNDGDFSKYKDFSATELFELFFDEDVFELLVRETNNYALFMNLPAPNITKDDIKCFFGILIFSGYHILPGKRCYWDSQPDMNQPFIVNSMRRNRFDLIMKNIHFADNQNLDTTDKMCKLRPLMTIIKKNFLKHFVPVPFLSFDESMIEYYGRHGCKQFIRGKPIRFGYKVWSLNAPKGYLINFDIYQGKSLNMPSDYEELFGKSSAPLVKMLDEIPEEKKNLPYNLVFDNLFTNFRLLKYLSAIGYGGLGTIREDRIPKCCPLLNKNEMKRNTNRGHFDSSLCKEDAILICKWHDNGVVSIATNNQGVNPVSKVKRYSQSERKTVLVDRPAVFGTYNENMGGTDRMDENVANYRISNRGKKWYWSIFTWLIDVALQNAWQLRRSSGQPQPQLDFKREVVQTYIARYGQASKGPGRPFSTKHSLTGNRVSDTVRYDGMKHYVTNTPEKKRRRCAGEGCCSSVRTMCKKCNIGLCLDCFETFHTVTF